jgi:diadenosine tetraphosphatase ApaH/serine/threonine PP2A family protein phosphatase
MRWAILSDVHGNLPALESAMDSLEGGRAVDGFAFLGDVLGYGADPNPCIETLRGVCSHWVAGNHDHGVLGLTDIGQFNDEAQEAILWSRGQLHPDHRSFLEGIYLELVTDEFLCVHATPQAPQQWNYIFTLMDAKDALSAMDGDLCFLGHSHVPLALCQDGNGQIQVLKDDIVEFRPDHRYLINPGSIGQPRDGDPRASFGIYDSHRKTFHLRRVPYDVQDAAQRIVRAGLPSSLAQRLFHGL